MMCDDGREATCQVKGSQITGLHSVGLTMAECERAVMMDEQMGPSGRLVTLAQTEHRKQLACTCPEEELSAQGNVHLPGCIVPEAIHAYTTGQLPPYADQEPEPSAISSSDLGDMIQMERNPGYNPDEQVNHPAHYGGDTTYEVIKVAEAWGLDADAYLFNVIKYIARPGKGNYLEDLKKARWYLDRRIARMERKS
jgi:Protein of unknwon function (DUF3310)